MSEEAVFSIGATGRMLGVSPATLRSWEERYQVVTPERSPGAQRLYSRDQLNQLRFVCQEIERGLSPADAHRALVEQLATDPHLGAQSERERAERTVLLVERDPYSAELAEYFLRTEGYAVVLARSTADAGRLEDEHSVDLAIVDLLIGGGAGLRICHELGARVPVLAVSTLEQRDRALEAGAQAFLRKPFEPLALVSAARDLLGTSALTRPARVPIA